MCTTLRRIAAIGSTVALLLSGCGGNGAAPPPPPEPPDLGSLAPSDAGTAAEPDSAAQTALDVCELLTPDEVEAAVGRPVTAEPVTEIDCNYTTTDDDVVDRTDITLSVLRPAGGTAETFVQAVEAGAGGGFDSQRIDGIGDAAVMLTGANASILNVKAGDAWLTLTVVGPDESDRSSLTARRLAELALGRLQ